jgi:hypothetical protein
MCGYQPGCSIWSRRARSWRSRYSIPGTFGQRYRLGLIRVVILRFSLSQQRSELKLITAYVALRRSGSAVVAGVGFIEWCSRTSVNHLVRRVGGQILGAYSAPLASASEQRVSVAE